MYINMPGILGTDAAAQILTKYPSVRIAIFSANVQEGHQTRATTLGARFVAKPVTQKSAALAFDYFEAAQVKPLSELQNGCPHRGF